MWRKNEFSFFDVTIYIMLFFVLCTVLLPMLYVFSLSLSGTEEIARGEITFYPKGFNFKSYLAILESDRIPRAYLNSFIYTSTAVVISLLLCFITAYPLSRRDLPGRNKFITAILFTMFFSGGLIPFYILMQTLGLINNIWALVLPWAIPQFELFLLKNYLENVPNEIHEAAVIDGASEYRTLFSIYWPMSKPILATLVIFFAMAQWNNYLIPLMYITSPEKFPLQLILQEMLIQDQAKMNSNMALYASLSSEGLKNATIILSILPLLILYPFVQKYFINGIYMGAVKG